MNSIHFSSTAEFDLKLKLQDLLIPNPVTTFFMRAKGSSMPDCGILNGDLLLVDRSITPERGALIVAVSEGQFIIKRFSNDPEIWGVITYAIHDLRFG